MSGHDDENEDFDALLRELEQAADTLAGRGGSEGIFAPTETVSDLTREVSYASSDDLGLGPVKLKEQPRSLVDLSALSFDQPLSHEPAKIPEQKERPFPGAVVDQKYEILDAARRTTEGFEVKHVVLRQKFVLQLLSPAIVDDPMLWPKFQSDIRAAGLLGHEHLEFVTDLGRCPTYGAYLVKQWIEGPTLDEYLKSAGKRPVAEAVEFAHSVGGAIAALHEIGIIHGRLSPATVRRVDASDGPTWKVLDVCIPGGDEVLVAPEQVRGEATGPEADQYALALLTLQLLTGGNAAVADSDLGVNEELAEVLRTAMSDHPLQRYADMEGLLKALLDAAPKKPAPTIAPFDRREATRSVRKQVERQKANQEEAGAKAAAAPRPPTENEPVEAQPVRVDHAFSNRPKSMVVAVDQSRVLPKISVNFATRARLNREYRRNILAGGLFIPTSDDLPLATEARVELRFQPRDASVIVDAMLVSFDPGGDARPRGYGVAFDARARTKIEAFMQTLDGAVVTANSKLVVKRKLDTSAKISAGEAFLLSRLTGATTAGAARAMFSGLPYDFDACLTSLIEGGWVGIDGASSATPAPIVRTHKPDTFSSPAPSVRPAAEPPASAETTGPRAYTFEDDEWDDVERVLETVAYFEEQGNFMAAGRVLESAAQNAPGVAVYLHRLGLLRARFDMNLDAARTSIRRARALDPRNDDYRASERYVATLVEISAVRVLWEHEFSDEGIPHWIRSEPQLGHVWLRVEGRGTRALVNVDFRAPRLEREMRSTQFDIVVANSAEFDALERRKDVDLHSAAARHERQVEIARRFGKFGPYFVRAPAPAAVSTNSAAAAASVDGLTVLRVGGKPLRLNASEVHDPCFAPDEQSLAWVAREKSDRWILYTSPLTGPASVRRVFETRPVFQWTDDSNSIVVLERRPGQLHVFDRKVGKARTLGQFPGFVDLSLLTASDGQSALVVGKRVIGEKGWVARWFDLRSAEILKEFVVPDGMTDGLLRPDGKLAATLRDGRLFLADLKGGTTKTVSTVSPYPGSLRGSWWTAGSPLILVEIVDATARVLSVDVDLLCG